MAVRVACLLTPWQFRSDSDCYGRRQSSKSIVKIGLNFSRVCARRNSRTARLGDDLQRLVGEQKVGELTRSIANLKELLVSTVVDELIQGMAEKNRPELEVIFALSGFGNLQDNPGSLIGTNLQQALFNGIQPHEQRKKLYTETLKKLGIN